MITGLTWRKTRPACFFSPHDEHKHF